MAKGHSNQISLTLPEWAIGRHIYIFAGAELLATKEVRIVHENGDHVAKYLPLKVKSNDGRCNPSSCFPNSCCATSAIPFSKTKFEEIKRRLNSYNHGDTPCPLLGREGCILNVNIPFGCVNSICTSFKGCTERLEVVD